MNAPRATPPLVQRHPNLARFIIGASATILSLVFGLDLAFGGPPAHHPRIASTTLQTKIRARWRRELLRAMIQRSSEALARLARQIGPARLLRALGDADDRPFRRAAIAAAPETARPWTLLPALLRLAKDPDRAEAIAAAQAARQIAEALRPGLLQRHEESPATLAPILTSLFQRARDPRISRDLRVIALLTAAALSDLTPADPRQVTAALAAHDPALRRAAVELCVGKPPLIPILLKIVRHDDDPGVRRAAGAAYCADLPRSARRAKTLRKALREGKLPAILRAIARDPHASRDELTDLRRCLHLLRDPASRHADRTLRRRLARWPRHATSP